MSRSNDSTRLVVWSRLLALAAVCLSQTSSLLCLSALASEPPPSPVEYIDSEYLVETWQTEQGLPDNFVISIAQTPEGYLWIATFNGLARFNGFEFVVFDPANTPELLSARITELHTDKQGRLWIKSEDGHITQWANGRFISFGPSGGLPDNGMALPLQDHAGEIWASSSWDITNYYHLVDGVFFKPVSSTNTFYHRFGNSSDAAGYGWGIRANTLFSVHPQPFEAVVPSFTGQGWRLAAAGNGGMWIIANRIQKYHPPSAASASSAIPQADSPSDRSSQGWFEDFGPIPVNTDNFTAYQEDSNGNLWVGTGVGELWRIGTNHIFRRFKFRNTTTLELGRSIFADAEGNLWIGNGGDGLVRLRPRILKTFDSSDGLTSDVVRSVTEDKDGNVWLATVNSVDWFPFSTGPGIGPANHPQAQRRGLSVALPWRVYGSRDGAVWIGTYGEGLLRLHGTETNWFTERRAGLNAGPPIDGIFEDRQGRMFFASPEGLYSIKDNRLAKCDWPAEVHDRDVAAIAEDQMGRLYLALAREGLLRKGQTGWEHFTITDGLPENHLSALYVDGEDALWIGTPSKGLSRFQNGKFFNFAPLNLELPRLITGILEDDTGHLWFGSNQGLYRAERRQLNQLANEAIGSGSSHETRLENSEAPGSFNISHYARSEGMGSSQCTGEACKAHDGKLWFATMKGVTVVDPQLLPRNNRPPPVVVEGVLVDDVLKSLNPLAMNNGTPAQRTITVGPGAHHLEIRYAGLSFTAPDRVRFRYRLEPLEKDWVIAGTRRAAYYNKIPPGSYRFQVLACNNDNVWSETGASISVVVQPLLWQTMWFRVIAALCLVGFAIGLYELRVLRLKRQQALQESFSRSLIESQENERKRIAAELHDSLGQSLLVVKNYAAMALKEPKLPDKTQKQLQEISDSASTSIEEVRTIARALRPYQLDRFGLTKTLEDAAETTAQAAHFPITTSVENIDGSFSAEAEISIYRIVQEWLNNVVKHSRAGKARMAVRIDDGIMRMVLEDDGVGFDYDAVIKRSAAGFGLANLAERARLLGGSLKIETSPGKGTRLLIDLPCKK